MSNSTSTEHSNNSNVNSNNGNTTIGTNGTNYIFNFAVEGLSEADTQALQTGSGPDMLLPTSHAQPEPSVTILASEPQRLASGSSYVWQPNSASTSQASNLTPRARQTFGDVESDENDNDVLSALPRSVNPIPKVITCSDMGKYIPKEMEEYIKRYMRTKLFDFNFIIPLFSPIKVAVQVNSACIGNVGFFNDLGGFTTLFNIFKTESQNRALGYNTVPSKFRPFHKTFDELPVNIRRLEPPKHWKYFGFEIDPEEEMTLCLPSKYNVNCAAIYMGNGCSVHILDRQDEMEIQDYLCDEQPRWQSHFDQNSPSQFKNLSFAVILGCCRAETWTFATGSSGRNSSQEKITLQELAQHQGRTRYMWNANDRSIRCEYGPTNDQLDQLEQYLSDEGVNSNLSAEACRDIRECHCVAVRVCVLRKPKWRLGASFASAMSSRSTIRPHFARMSMPSILNRY